MQNNLVGKSLVIGIIFLFVGAGVVSATNSNINAVNLNDEICKLNPDIETIYPSDDSWISMGNPNYNGGSNTILSVRNRYGAGGTDYWEADILIKFDISDIPKGATIKSAKLNIYYAYYDCNPPKGDLNLYRLLGDWDEDTVTYNNHPDSSSQLTTYSTVPGSPAQYMVWNVTSDIQKFVNGDWDNYGWKLMDENFWGTFDIPILKFYSKEYESDIPYLEIEFTRSRSRDITNPFFLRLFEHFPNAFLILERLLEWIRYT